MSILFQYVQIVIKEILVAQQVVLPKITVTVRTADVTQNSNTIQYAGTVRIKHTAHV